MIHLRLITLCLLITTNLTVVEAQQKIAANYTLSDTLRGSIGPGRIWWDALDYKIDVKFNLKDSTISGSNEIKFKALSPGKEMQIDLQEPLEIDSVINKNNPAQKFTWRRIGNAFFLSPVKYLTGSINTVKVFYHGKPRAAVRPPWDGGISWRSDINKSPWISISCQALGASVWFPCKDHQSDEPDKASLTITAPANLVSISNGRLVNKIHNADNTTSSTWTVVNPINSYCIIPYIGKYVHFGEKFQGENGQLDLDYWVLEQNLEKAKVQFTDVARTMKAFEYWFGPYPFYEDGFKLIDAPYLGMEHQSAVAYGNGYRKGYAGIDLSGRGPGLLFDFIIVHEAGHEWWGNNITTKDIADMWVHEAFADYSEALFLQYHYNKDSADIYVQGKRKRIANDIPIIGPFNVNREGSGDMYYKGGNMLHTIRQVINDDVKFRAILRGLNKTFWHSTITGKQVENYINLQSGKDLRKIFDQYLRTTMIPGLEYNFKKGVLSYRWQNVVKGFNMPVNVKLGDGKMQLINPVEKWKTMKTNAKTLMVDPNYYINAVLVNN